ncbi:MAG: phospholipid carrier-dependent glycosyltransferase [Candidatus Dormibacteraeota bacterium]|nr:phospholipid carrier-dependent glycosyltransferase [Candidatus Dormibacteraeota bacterium]
MDSDATESESAPLVRAGLRGFLELDRIDVVVVVALVLLSFALRFASPILPNFLTGGSGVSVLGVGYPYNTSTPECITVPVGPAGTDVTGQHVNHTDVTRCGFVFDEVYFPVDAAKDLRQPAESYFDPEPPLAKLLMTPPIAFGGFDTWTWRWSTVIFGSLLVGVVYLIGRRLRRNDRFFAFAAAAFMSLDGLAFVESRTGVIDIIAIFFVALFYWLFLLHWQARTRTQWRVSLYIMALAAGLAFGAKLTMLAPLVVAGALILGRALAPYLVAGLRWLRNIEGPGLRQTDMWRSAAGRRGLLHYIAGAAVMVAVFCACYSRYLTIPHDDVYFFTKCDPASAGLTGTAKTLNVPTFEIGGVTLPNPAEAVYNIYEINDASLVYHELECHSHPYSSHWYTWPVSEHPVLFYLSTASSGQESSITDMGNPAVWWLAIPALLFCVWRMTRGPTWWRVSVSALGVASLAGMIITFHAAQLYHPPNNYNLSLTASQFSAMEHRDPTPSDEFAHVTPSALFDVFFAGTVLFAAVGTLGAVLSRRFVPAFIVLGYLAAWMMWVPGNERRVLFYYHALGMLIFTVLALAYGLTALRRLRVPVGRGSISLAPLAWGGVAVVLAAFIFFYPVWTAAPLAPADHQMRIWVDTG